MRTKHEQKAYLVTLEQVIAGGLLVFNTIDEYLLESIIEFLKKQNIRIRKPLDYDFELLGDYVDRLIDITPLGGPAFTHKNRAVGIEKWAQHFGDKEILTEIAGDTLSDLFVSKKDTILSKGFKNDRKRAVFLEETRILLISDKSKDYEKFASRGFKNITFEKSMVRAEKYFQNHPNELQKYHIFAFDHPLADDESYMKTSLLKREIDKIVDAKRGLLVDLSVYNLDGESSLRAYVQGLKPWHNWSFSITSNAELFESIMGALLKGEVIDFDRPELDSSFKEPIPINPQTIPSKRGDIKILYTSPLATISYVDKLLATTNDLGLDATIIHDDEQSFWEVSDKLGDYDIVIGSKLNLSKLPYISIEAGEQCKDTGRAIVLLSTYDCSSKPYKKEDGKYIDFGCTTTLEYSHGLNRPGPKSMKRPATLSFEVPPVICYQNSNFDRNLYMELAKMVAILERSILLYDEALQNLKLGHIDGIDANSLETLNLDAQNRFIEYLEFDRLETERIARAKEAIALFDNIRILAAHFLEKKRRGKNKEPDGLKISSTKKGVRIEAYGLGKLMCALTYSKKDSIPDARVFVIETLNKKKILTPPVTIELSTRRDMRSTPPSEDQENTLKLIFNRLDAAIKMDGVGDVSPKRLSHLPITPKKS